MRGETKLYPGFLLGGRYRITRKIGSGGMSHVYEAMDCKFTGKLWAVKEGCNDSSTVSTMQSEASLLISLRHIGIPQIVDFFSLNDGYTYLVMEFIEGMTLDQYVCKHQKKLSINRIIHFSVQILDVLHYLHTYDPIIIYRDLKPSNIMITKDDQVRLIDFGIARNFKEHMSQDTVIIGTYGFAAPEQYGLGQTDARSDLYGFGALLLHLMTCGMHTEWSSEANDAIGTDTPSFLKSIVQKLLRKLPEQRFQSASEVRSHFTAHNRIDHSDEVFQRPNGRRTKVIAVVGASAGVGVTHTVICISHHLCRNKQKVACIEMSTDVNSFTHIQKSIEGNHFVCNDSNIRFEIDGVHYWRQRVKEDVIGLLGSGYDYLVIDLGNEFDEASVEEFLRADLSIVVGSGAEWRHLDMIHFFSTYAHYKNKNWVCCLPLAPIHSVKNLRKKLNHSNIYALPIQKDPFYGDECMDRTLEEILRGCCYSKQTKKRWLRR